MNNLRSIIFPKTEKEVQQVLDSKSLDNIRNICWVVFAFEAVALLIFLLTRKGFDEAAFVSIRSVSFCLIACLIGALCSGKLRSMDNPSHVWVEVFEVCFYLVLSSWAVQVAFRNYCNNEQILTFFAVQLMMVCFVPIRPLMSIVFAGLIYIVMYVILTVFAGSAGINIFNYVLLMLVTIIGMIVRYHSQISTIEKSVELEKSNDLLFYNNRHDGLTGLRNRKALEEDVHKIINKPVTAYMIDVNYFKKINDTYGHAVGDQVLSETAAFVKSLFSLDRCYRYGGDEFLILSEDDDSFNDDTATISIPDMPELKVLLSIGRADGEPKDHDELFRLISEADGKLYEIKKKTHSEEVE